MKCSIMLGIALSACVAASAADVETKFPSAGGDLSDAEAWGGTLPGTDAHLVLTNAGTYTLSKAAEFASIRQAASGDFVFDFTGSTGWLTLNGCSSANGSEGSMFCFPYYYKTASTTLKGGTWCGSGSNMFKPVGLGNCWDWGGTYNDYSFTMTNGCVVTNVASVVFSKRIANFNMLIADKSKIFSNGGADLTDAGGSNVDIRMTSGAELHVKNLIYSDGGSTVEGLKRDLLFDVSGAGTKVCVGNSVYVGFRGSVNNFRISDFAVLEVGTNIVLSQTSYSKSNTLEVLNGAAVSTKEMLVQSDSANRVSVSNATLTAKVITINNADTLGNSFEIMDGAEVAVTNLYCRRNSRLDVSEASLNVLSGMRIFGSPESKARLTIWDAAQVTAQECDFYSNVVAEISGKGTKFTKPDGNPLLAGGRCFSYGNNAVILKDGYEDKKSVPFEYMNSPSNLMVVTGGTVFDRSSPEHKNGNNVFLGYSKTGEFCSRDNRVEITDGGVFNADEFYVCGSNNTVVVSNGTLIAGSQVTEYSLWFGYANGTATKSDNVTLIIAGTNPVVRCYMPTDTVYGGFGSLTMQHNSVLRYDIPKEGYAKGHVPFIARINTIDGASLEVNCEEWAANPGIEGNKLVLFRTPKDTTAFEGKIKACKDSLPPGVTLSYKNHELILRRPGSGYRIILR